MSKDVDRLLELCRELSKLEDIDRRRRSSSVPVNTPKEEVFEKANAYASRRDRRSEIIKEIQIITDHLQ